MKKLFLWFLCGFFLSVAFALVSESVEQDRIISRALSIWEPDLASAMVKNQMFLIERITSSFRSEIIDAVSITKAGSPYFSVPAISALSECPLSKNRPLVLYGKEIGNIQYCKSIKNLVSNIPLSLVFWAAFLGFIALTLVVQMFSLRGYQTSLLNTLEYLNEWAHPESEQHLTAQNAALKQNDPLSKKLLELVNDGTKARLEVAKVRTDLEKSEVMWQIASQVSHDVRSPLAALRMITEQLTNIPEDKRILIRSSVARINDISNELLNKGKEIKKQNTTDGSQQNTNSVKGALAIQLLSPLIDSIVSEKRIQFREKQGVEIEADINHGYGLFANINATELKRTLSNLITNAVEALPNNIGRVVVTVRKVNANEVAIVVQDNGKGIPEHILKKLGELGVSHGKEGTQSGSGLGVYHAKKTVEESGGQFVIQSHEGAGTTISMTFKKAPAPKWFVEKLVFEPGMMITSLDDDISIHQIWKGRFESKNMSTFNISHCTFTAGPDFKNLVTSQSSPVGASPTDFRSPSRLYLVDYELLNQKATGLDIIEELGIGAQSILVTSRYEEEKIRERCDRLGVKLIPKAMAGFVPIEIAKPKELFDGILLDDDSLVHSFWGMAANAQNKKFIGFYNPSDFFSRAAEFDLESKVYVDSNLGNGVKGEEISKKIKDLGFKDIYLCTGYQASDFPSMPWITAIVPKDPQL